ncbi:hypothetical protein J6590_091242 [Homalodisca vitripennis]|nr:hypothetical protein J6590_091242 [Homalodisca vitripennis]
MRHLLGRVPGGSNARLRLMEQHRVVSNAPSLSSTVIHLIQPEGPSRNVAINIFLADFFWLSSNEHGSRLQECLTSGTKRCNKRKRFDEKRSDRSAHSTEVPVLTHCGPLTRPQSRAEPQYHRSVTLVGISSPI